MIRFNSRRSFYKKPFGAIEKNTDLFLQIKVTGDRSVSSACLYFTCDETGHVFRTEGKKALNEQGKKGSDNQGKPSLFAGLRPSLEPEALYEFSLQIDKIGLYFYYFETIYEDGSREQTPVNQLTVYDNGYVTPLWLKNGVMYQIFPDRFARSAGYQAPKQYKNYVLRKDWGGLPNDRPDENGIIQNNDFFGGNLRGIIEQLDDLQSLGVTVIYLNPIFEAYSNHRYDTADYKKIDPLLGTEEDFIELCDEARSRGIRILLDGVFNHTGSDSIYFNKNGRYSGLGAYQSVESPYYSWYRFLEHPEKYEAWWGIDTLPDINETEPSYLDYVIRSEDSVVRHWLRCGASGFRLDVADELPDEFLEELRAAVKETNPDGAVIGEVWEDASNKMAYGRRRKYFLGNQLDSVMNYPLKDAVIDYLVNRKDGTELEMTINSLWENYPKPAFSALMNIMGTHDTPRILSVLGESSGDDGCARQRLFLDLLITSFMPGIPCIYYGDELGMKGGRDPFNRMCYIPEQGDPMILRFFRRLFAFRRRIDGLEDFEFRPRSAEGSFYSFSRVGKKSRLVVAANSGGQDYLLNLAITEKEILKDFFISGSVSFERYGVFRIRENSGIAAWITDASI